MYEYVDLMGATFNLFKIGYGGFIAYNGVRILENLYTLIKLET